MKTIDFDYFLHPELIVQTPVEPRTQSWLMVLNSWGSVEGNAMRLNLGEAARMAGLDIIVQCRSEGDRHRLSADLNRLQP